MSKLTLQEVFGSNATQDINNLVIEKNDLPLLVVSDDNHAQALIAAILLLAQKVFVGYLTDTNGRDVSDSKGIAIDFDQSGLYDLKVFLWRTHFIKDHIVFQFEIFYYDDTPIPPIMQIKDYPSKATVDPNDLLLIQDSVDGTYKNILVSTLSSYIASTISTTGTSGSGSGSTDTSNGGFAASFYATNSDNKIVDANGNIFLTSGSPVISSAQKRGVLPALYLDGLSYVYKAAADSPQFADHSFCMQCWIFLLDDPTHANNMVIMGNAAGGASGNAGCFLAIDQGKLILRHWINGNSNATSLTNVPQNQWVFVVGNRKGTNIDVYLAGAKGTSGVIEATNTDGQFNIGTVPGNAGYASNFHGYIQAVTVSASSDIYESNFTPPS